ncbi:MAG: tetraacyldisaccharide 4'-kinase [Fusobacteriaceae bacterium]
MTVLVFIYYAITFIRNKLFDMGILSMREVSGVEIICVGNITVGGTGKTPCVQFFVKRLQRQGKKVAIVSRGYKGKRKKDPFLVSDGRKIFCTARESGDESFLHALNLKVPVIVSVDRYAGCLFAKKHYAVDAIVLDDGFQHRKLKRNRDIVLIDATNPFGGGNLLPIGTLREDFRRACKRASEFIITKSNFVTERDVEFLKRYLKQKQENKPVSIARHGVVSLCDIKGNQKPLFWINDKRVLLFSGLANPMNFEKTVISLNPKYIERVDFLDHHEFKRKDIAKIREIANQMRAEYILTTEKDFVKLPLDLNLENVYILKIEFEMVEDNSGIKEIESEASF